MAVKSRNKVIVGLDIGTTNITVVVADVSTEGRLDVIGVGVAPSRGLRKGVVINIESTVSSISKAVSQAETMAGCSIESVYASLSGSHIRSFNSHGIVGIRHREVSAFDVEKVMEAAKAVAIPMDREILHVIPQEFIVDEQDGIKDPIGISGVRLEARVHIVTGAVASAQNIVKCANRCGLAVEDIVLAPIAAAHSVLTAEEQELGVCLIDIGGGTADVAVYRGGAVQHSAVIAIGGSHITNDIAAGIRTPLSSAEEIKCRYATALASSVRRDEMVEVPSTGGRSPRVISKTVLAEIVEPRVTEIFTLVHRELVRASVEGMLTSGIVLTGGTSQLSGICELAEQIFNCPVRAGVATGFGGLTDLVRGPEYGTAIGLVHYAMHRKANAHLSKPKNFASRVFRKVSGLLSDYF